MAPRPDRLLVAHQQAVEAVRRAVESFALTAWRGQASYRDADIDRLVRVLVPQVKAGQIRVANLTSAFIAKRAGVKPVPVDRAYILDARGVPSEKVYRRPATTVYTKLSEGASLADAVAAGASRLGSLVGTDMQLAKTRQADASMRGSGFTYYRRVLTGNENCALCVIASTQRYRVGNLMPIHPGCDCGVDELKAGEDPGQLLDGQLLEDTQSRIANLTGTSDAGARDLGRGKRTSSGERVSDYTDLIETSEHGEYGPTLHWRSDHFTGPADI